MIANVRRRETWCASSLMSFPGAAGRARVSEREPGFRDGPRLAEAAPRPGGGVALANHPDVHQAATAGSQQEPKR